MEVESSICLSDLVPALRWSRPQQIAEVLGDPRLPAGWWSSLALSRALGTAGLDWICERLAALASARWDHLPLADLLPALAVHYIDPSLPGWPEATRTAVTGLGGWQRLRRLSPGDLGTPSATPELVIGSVFREVLGRIPVQREPAQTAQPGRPGVSHPEGARPLQPRGAVPGQRDGGPTPAGTPSGQGEAVPQRQAGAFTDQAFSSQADQPAPFPSQADNARQTGSFPAIGNGGPSRHTGTFPAVGDGPQGRRPGYPGASFPGDNGRQAGAPAENGRAFPEPGDSGSHPADNGRSFPGSGDNGSHPADDGRRPGSFPGGAYPSNAPGQVGSYPPGAYPAEPGSFPADPNASGPRQTGSFPAIGEGGPARPFPGAGEGGPARQTGSFPAAGENGPARQTGSFPVAGEGVPHRQTGSFPAIGEGGPLPPVGEGLPGRQNGAFPAPADGVRQNGTLPAPADNVRQSGTFPVQGENGAPLPQRPADPQARPDAAPPAAAPNAAQAALPGAPPAYGAPARDAQPIPSDTDHAMVRVVDNLFRSLDKLELAVAVHRLFAEDPVSLRTLAHKMLVDRDVLSQAQRTAEERVLHWLRSSESAPVTGHMFRLTEWLGAAATEDQLIGADPAHPAMVPSLRTPLWRVLVTLMPDRRFQDGWLVVGDLHGLQARTRKLMAANQGDVDIVELMTELGIRSHSAQAWLDALPPESSAGHTAAEPAPALPLPRRTPGANGHHHRGGQPIPSVASASIDPSAALATLSALSGGRSGMLPGLAGAPATPPPPLPGPSAEPRRWQRIEVTPEHLRGGPVPVPEGYATQLGMRPGTLLSVTGPGDNAIVLVWQGQQPVFDSLQPVLMRLNARPGDQVYVTVDGYRLEAQLTG